TERMPTRKGDFIAIILREMMNAKHLESHWGNLDGIQQKAVAEAVYAPTFDAGAFGYKYGEDPNWGESDRWSYSIRQPSLLNLFILERGNNRTRAVPSDLKALLKAFVPKPPSIKLETLETHPETVTVSYYTFDPKTYKRKETAEDVVLLHYDTEHAAQHDLLAVLRLIDAGKVRVSAKTRRPTAATIKAVTEMLLGGDFYPENEDLEPYETDPRPIKAFAWPLIVQAAGLTRISGTKLQLSPTGRKALTAPPHSTLQTAWNRWLKTTLLDELNRVNVIRGQTGRGKRGLTAPAKRRKTVVGVLKKCPPNRWVAFDEFYRYMRASGILLEVSVEPWELYIEEHQYGQLDGGGALLASRYMMVFLFEYAATLGLIDLAYLYPSNIRDDYADFWGADDLDALSRYDGLMYFRLNNLGAWCLGRRQNYTPSSIEIQQIFTVLPNLDVVASGPLQPADRIVLEQFAKQASDAIWKIQSEQLLKSVEAGHSVADMETFLKTRSGGQLPETVAIFFSDIVGKIKQLKDLGTARLIEVADPAVATLIAHDSSLKNLCLPAGETHIVVPVKSETIFRSRLRKLGYVLPPSE
ncbi:MAG: helicase-associated domain-containing protein, partial [bacterium]|nr:helicase-associated domain-containing protein [bacterium]